MRHMYSHLGEYRKIFLANYLCIGFVPGGNYYEGDEATICEQKTLGNQQQ